MAESSAPAPAQAATAARAEGAGEPQRSPAGGSPEPGSPEPAPFFLLYPGDGGAGSGARLHHQPQPPPWGWRTPPSPGSPLPFLLLSSPAPAGTKPHPNYLMANERMNLMNMAKLSIKGLIESALNLGRTLDSDYAPLQQFFVVMEHCLKHGLKAKKTFLGQNKSFWGPLELVEKLVPEAGEITASVKDLPGLKTPVGRGRAWLRLALMQKKLSEYMKALINKKELLSEFYEPNALMMEEEGAIIAGLLVGLNVIDANFCMKGEDLDSQVGVIDFSMYLKDGNSTKGSEGDGQITAILDQKNYVEELNRHLNATVNNLQAKVDALEKSNTKLTEELAVANNRIITLQEEMERVKEESSYILESNRKGTKQDRTADGQALSEARKHLKEETQLRLDVEKELEMQISMRQEMELAMKMLEKDVCEKQDALVSLRQQLDDLRALKHELSFKLQSSDLGVKQKSELNSRLEEKTNQMAATIKQLEQRLRQAERGRQSAEEDNRLFKQDFGDKINSLQLEVEALLRQRNQLEQELKQERERRLQSSQRFPEKVSPKPVPKMDGKHKIQEENDKLKKPLEEGHTILPTKLQPHSDDQQNVCKNCGGTFCGACSARELPLPSSIRPERVCNPCHDRLLQQYSSQPLIRPRTEREEALPTKAGLSQPGLGEGITVVMESRQGRWKFSELPSLLPSDSK
ncbi:protein RUFY3 isoform X3 [Sarcophilus harrisii]|uniref:protein RUFY3 isoform X3 n=1 Tax=Sarcophilus harrisii TaxID=9305 RepID=UPI001301A349|nr:protein RUFY3 isoform X3 [Sarcophilus harrisii]